jgi:hypothetical protein
VYSSSQQRTLTVATSSSRFLRASTSSLRMILQNLFEQTNLGWCRRESTRNRCRDRCATRASQPRWTSTRSSFPRDRSWRSDSFAPLSSGLFQMPQNVPISPEKHPVKRSQNPGKMLRRLVELVGIEPMHRSQRWRLPSYLLYLSRLSSRVRPLRSNSNRLAWSCLTTSLRGRRKTSLPERRYHEHWAPDRQPARRQPPLNLGPAIRSLHKHARRNAPSHGLPQTGSHIRIKVSFFKLQERSFERLSTILLVGVTLWPSTCPIITVARNALPRGFVVRRAVSGRSIFSIQH